MAQDKAAAVSVYLFCISLLQYQLLLKRVFKVYSIILEKLRINANYSTPKIKWNGGVFFVLLVVFYPTGGL